MQGSDSSVFDLTRHGAVGTLNGIAQYEGHRLYLIGPDMEKAWGSYRFIRRISKQEGAQIIRAYREQWEERWRSPVGENGERLSIPDQIRAYLRQEARTKREAQCSKPDSCSLSSHQFLASYSQSQDATAGEADATTQGATGEISA